MQAKPNQQAKVLRYLMNHKTLSPREALADLGIYRLSDVIFKLRNKGWSIDTDIRENPATGQQYGVYQLAGGHA